MPTKVKLVPHWKRQRFGGLPSVPGLMKCSTMRLSLPRTSLPAASPPVAMVVSNSSSMARVDELLSTCWAAVLRLPPPVVSARMVFWICRRRLVGLKCTVTASASWSVSPTTGTRVALTMVGEASMASGLHLVEEQALVRELDLLHRHLAGDGAEVGPLEARRQRVQPPHRHQRPRRARYHRVVDGDAADQAQAVVGLARHRVEPLPQVGAAGQAAAQGHRAEGGGAGALDLAPVAPALGDAPRRHGRLQAADLAEGAAAQQLAGRAAAGGRRILRRLGDVEVDGVAERLEDVALRHGAPPPASGPARCARSAPGRRWAPP